MTYKEFLQLEREAKRKDLQLQSLDVFSFGIERAQKRIDHLKKLIALSRQVDSKTLVFKRAQWERQIAKLTQSCTRLENLKREQVPSPSYSPLQAA